MMGVIKSHPPTIGKGLKLIGGICFVNSESASQVDLQVEGGEGQNLLTGIGHRAVNVIEIINVGVQ
jgi:hypothetical protein